MKALRIGILIVASALALFPLWWEINGSLLDNTAVLQTPPPMLPFGGDLENYRVILASFPIFRWLWNSTVVMVGVVVLELAIAFPAAYALEVLQFRGSRKVWVAFLVSMMLPNQLSLIPLYKLMRAMGMTTTRWGLIVPFTLSIFAIFVLRAYLRDFPRELLDAAEMDGATERRKLLGILMPLSVPVLAALGTMAAIGTWNNFFWQSLVANTPRNRTLVVGVARAVWDKVVFHQLGLDFIDYGLLMAGAVLVFLPMGVLFVFTSRYVMKGLYASTGVFK